MRIGAAIIVNSLLFANNILMDIGQYRTCTAITGHKLSDKKMWS